MVPRARIRTPPCAPTGHVTVPVRDRRDDMTATTCDLNAAIATANQRQAAAAAHDADYRKSKRLARTGGLAPAWRWYLAAPLAFAATVGGIGLGMEVAQASVPAGATLVIVMLLAGVLATLELIMQASIRTDEIRALARMLQAGCDDEQVVELAARAHAGRADLRATVDVICQARNRLTARPHQART